MIRQCNQQQKSGERKQELKSVTVNNSSTAMMKHNISMIVVFIAIATVGVVDAFSPGRNSFVMTTGKVNVRRTLCAAFGEVGSGSRMSTNGIDISSSWNCLWTPSLGKGKSSARSFSSTSSLVCLNAVVGGGTGGGSRESEIRRKIMKLKREGRLKKPMDTNEFDDDDDDDEEETKMKLNELGRMREEMKDTAVADQYAAKLKRKLGKQKSALIGAKTGIDFGSLIDDDDDEDDEEESKASATGKIGKLGRDIVEEDDETPSTSTDKGDEVNVLNPTTSSVLEAEEEEEDDLDLSEEALVDLVANKLEEKLMKEAALKQKELDSINLASQILPEDLDVPNKVPEAQIPKEQTESTSTKKSTTGIGGTWSGEKKAEEEKRRPSRGSWGYFPRPNDISRAYGGGKRIGAGFESDVEKKAQSIESTRDLLRRYREKAGIEVQSEKDHAAEIQEALDIGERAMQRGVYGTAVSALEKVTKYCSTNSKVGGKVFLELAMAYEANGRTQEAITVYTTLSNSRIEDIKYNAKRLLYGIEAMNFMRNEAKSKAFSRQNAKQTFIDTTGLANIAQNFDKVYNTAYVDLDSRGSLYRQLTESVVRSNREARQILIKAVDSGEVDRLKIVQALRSMSRNFDEALSIELEQLEQQKRAEESVAVINGKPIVQGSDLGNLETQIGGMDKFVLASADQMLENLSGEWRLQLLADKRGDGVKFYNSTLSWQTIDAKDLTFESKGPAGFTTVSKNGDFEFNKERRIMKKRKISTGGAGSWLSALVGGDSAPDEPQQIICVDSVFCITKLAPDKSKKAVGNENVKNYFVVWRRVEPGTYSKVQ
mmetsp:Transcript_27310/g.40027  ORF Transcript_27310/g.40027 Transcript_27310/m.40027 type:complete len:826 (+) Transcript_27310:215-2692(+)